MAKHRQSWCSRNTAPLILACAVLGYGAWLFFWQPTPAPGEAFGDSEAFGSPRASPGFRPVAPLRVEAPFAAVESPPPKKASSEPQYRNSSLGDADFHAKVDLPAPSLPVPNLPETKASGAAPLVVALAARLKQIDGALVVISSAIAHADDASRLRFRVVTAAEDVVPLVSQLKARLAKQSLASGAASPLKEPDIAAVDFGPWTPRVSRLLGGKSSSRKELFDELNFAAFYLHEVLPGVPRVLYLDTDVVVRADLAAELASRDLHGQPAGVAEDCSQKMGKYVHMDRLKKKGVQQDLPYELKATKKACVVNRGVVLIDTERWAATNITGAIEALVAAHLTKSKGPLWRSGVSQPPFLLAIAGRYHDLGAEYNVRGLGRGDIAPEEVDHYKRLKAWSSYFDKFLRKCEFNCCPGCKGWALSPYVSPLAHQAKILHFNGRLKPSAFGRRDTAPLFPPPAALGSTELAAREQRPLCSCGPKCLQECSGLWWKYLPPALD
ncbi:unnamed protein product [Polarella glacialis]|uniref:Hexosyltransferase n=1 Tax=Polarella glacialis TaxID=89957 RepID=A0A813L759_POLGL|nr:unnamed protein product [Polarella glacialis]